MDANLLKATVAEQRDDHVAALERERRGYQQRLDGAKLRKDEGEANVVKARIDAVDEQLKHFKSNAGLKTFREQRGIANPDVEKAVAEAPETA